MPAPKFNFCVVCEQIRPDVGGKLTILGFYGLAPDVEILASSMEQPLGISFIVGFPAVSANDANKPYQHCFIITDPNGKVLAQTANNQLNVVAETKGMVAIGFILPPTVAGKYTLKVLVNNELNFEATFKIRAATPEELAKAGILPIVK
jgi:hypothetical protein